MSTTEAVQVAGTCDLICNLKAAVTALECQQQMNMLKEHSKKKCKKPPPPPMFVMIPLEQSMNGNGDSDSDDRTKFKSLRGYDSESEYSESLASSRSATSQRREDSCRIAKGPGIRGGVLHGRCNCIHRDGLQDTCPLTECQNEPKCMLKPWAKCPPAKYFRERFPDNYP